jgi:GNAT superfamily N-acetyltransferase
MFVITPAQPHHQETLVALDALIMGNEERRMSFVAAIDDGQMLIAQQDEHLVGLLKLDHHFFGQPFIDLLEVHPEYRRCGVGSALLAAAEARCAPGKLFTSTNQSNLPMQALCAVRGYLAAGVVLHLDPGDPELIFVKLL